MGIYDTFEDDAITPDTRAFITQLRAGGGGPSVLNTPLAQLREAKARGSVRLAAGSDEVIAGPGGELPLRCFSPEHPGGAYLHVHGGGFVMGGPDQQDVLLDTMARRAGMAVISVGYRLAPEYRFPAAPDDCLVAAIWLAEQARAGRFGSGPLFIGGESAGAHLAVSVLLRLREMGHAGLFRAALLNFGIFDLALSASARRWWDLELIISTPILRRYMELLLGPDDDVRSPLVSPVHADLAGLPPALFTVGSLDPLFDDSQLMAQRWIKAGNSAELAVYPGGVHGFTLFALPIAQAAIEHQVDYLTQMAADPP